MDTFVRIEQKFNPYLYPKYNPHIIAILPKCANFY